MSELRATAREGSESRVAELISKALEAFGREDFESSAAYVRDAKVLAPRSARTMELLGLAYYRLGKWKEAQRELLAYRRVTNSTDQNHLIADLYRAQGRPDRALEITAEVRPESTSPELWAETMIVAAGALADKEDLRGALAMLNRADLNPDQVEGYHLRLWYVLADLLERSGRRREAAERWARIVAEDPDFFDAQRRMAGREG
jgi:tetratricopeptide (TPR) repeat protein